MGNFSRVPKPEIIFLKRQSIRLRKRSWQRSRCHLRRSNLAGGLAKISQKCANPATAAESVRFPYNLNGASVANRHAQHLLTELIHSVGSRLGLEGIGVHDDHSCVVILQCEECRELALNGKTLALCGALQSSGPGDRFHFLVLHEGWKSRSSDAACVVVGRSVNDCNYLCSQSIRQHLHKLSCCRRRSTQDEAPILTGGHNLIEKPNLFGKEPLCCF